MLLKNNRRAIPDNFNKEVSESSNTSNINTFNSNEEEPLTNFSIRPPVLNNDNPELEINEYSRSIKRMLSVSFSLAILNFAAFVPKYYVSPTEIFAYLNVMLINIYLLIFILVIRKNTRLLVSYTSDFSFGYIRRKFNNYSNLTGMLIGLLFGEMFVKIMRDNSPPSLMIITVLFLVTVMGIFSETVLRDSQTISEAERSLR